MPGNVCMLRTLRIFYFIFLDLPFVQIQIITAVRCHFTNKNNFQIVLFKIYNSIQFPYIKQERNDQKKKRRRTNLIH